jgi:phosphohistidine phosphatase
MELYVVRHAIAAARDPARWPDDARRPLTAGGIVRFRPAARGLGRIADDVEVVLSSPYPRAWQTAELLREQAGWPAPERCEALEAERSPDAALELLSQRSGAASVALVGHEPHLSSLASLLLAGDAAAVRLALKKGGAVSLSCPDPPVPGEAVLRWVLTPRILRALGQSR